MPTMPKVSLPAEILARIFVLTADIDGNQLFQPGFPTSFSESVWGTDRGEWKLRSPEQAMDMLQRMNGATQQAISSTCRQWREIGFATLFRCLYLSHAAKVAGLRATLDSCLQPEPPYGWWTKRIHIGPYIWPGYDSSSLKEYQENIYAVIRHCPNIDFFITERSLGSSFGPVMEALALPEFLFLHTIQLVIPGEFASKVIGCVGALSHIIAVCLDIETEASSTEEAPGSASGLQLEIPHLQQISLRGYMDTLLEQLRNCTLPSLCSFSVENSAITPDIERFLRHHGSNLSLLNLTTPATSIPIVLDLCPTLNSFAFNADSIPIPLFADIVNRPHPKLTTIGLHGLHYAFEVGARHSLAMASSPSNVSNTTDLNDFIMNALNKNNFPQLFRIRVLSRRVLEDLMVSNGPAEGGGSDRFFMWSRACANAGIRLEDCTGHLLGRPP